MMIFIDIIVMILTKNIILRQVDPSDILRNHLIFFENNPKYIYKYIVLYNHYTCTNNWIYH